MEYNLPYPNIWHRAEVKHYELHRGSVVAFRKYESNGVRTGIIVMDSRDMMLAAVNLYKEEGRIWWVEDLPDDLELFEANEAETIWGYRLFLEEQTETDKAYEGKNPFVAFVERESPQQDNSWEQESFCQDFLSYVPQMLEQEEWQGLKQQLWQTIVHSGGLQFNRYTTEYYCYLIAVLMIAESGMQDFTYQWKIKQLKKEWYQLSWMYGMAIGRVTGTALNNFTAVVKQAGQGRRKHYLHLYLPLVENNVDKICGYQADNRYKLLEAIRQMRVIEAREEQKTDLDDLYHILFPKHFVLAMSASRPAATIAGLKEEVAAKDHRIKELENAVDDLTNRYQALLEQLKIAVKDVEDDKISPKDLIAAFLRLPTELALAYYGNMSILMAQNKTWQKYAPTINERILAKQQEQQDRQQEMDKAVKKSLEEPRTENIYGDKNEFTADSKLVKMELPPNADPAEIARRITEQGRKQIKKK